MGIGRAEARLENIERRVYLKGAVLEIIDKFDNNRVIGTVASWNREKLNPTTPGQPHYLFKIEQRDDGISTPENLRQYALAFNGAVHDVITRDEPESTGDVLWYIRTSPNGERIR